MCDGSAGLAVASSSDWATQFAAWKEQHGKKYASPSLEAKAFSAWAQNEEKIVEHNALSLPYTLGHNEFSDLTADEFFAKYVGYDATGRKPRAASMHVPVANETLPESIDWVAKGAVTPVKNQGQCGSCWAFSTTGAIEGAYAIATGKLVSLSEQELVQCDDVDQGCSGGLMNNAFKYVEQHGLAAESDYPYTSGTGIRGLCNDALQKKPVAHVTGYKDVASKDEDALKSAVAQQPVSVAIEADKRSFQLYKSGVFSSPFCGKQLDHGVLVVGYGSERGLLLKHDFWKVKNSWGSTWGEDGYIKIARGKNMCGIALQPSYPTGAAAGAPSMVEDA